MTFEKILPERGQLDAQEAAAALRSQAAVRAERPYVAVNFASTADGRVAIGGRSGPIGNEADRELFHELRAQADAVMVGAGTASAEGYGRLIRDPDRRERRRQAGLEPEPLAVIVSARLSLDPGIPLLQDPDARVVIVTGSDRELEGCAARVEYLRPPDVAPRAGELEADAGLLTLRPLIELLRERHGVELVLCEGGPVLHSALLREGLVDELFLSLAPKLAGGAEPTIVFGPPLQPPVEMELLSVLHAGGHLFLRYRVAPE
jgi:riboflavin-specific deaminase-like protein